jgi:hypothetical protein
VKALYEGWKKTFSQVCGYEFLSAKLDVRELFNMYDIPHSSDTDLSKLLFSVHTYYVLLIKFLAAEITAAYASPLIWSFLDSLVNLDSSKLKSSLQALEEGGIFSDMGIKNFLEGDFFSWYLDVWDDKVKEVVSVVIRRLLEEKVAEIRDVIESSVTKEWLPLKKMLSSFITKSLNKDYWRV